jgi:hypothetical protein
VRIYLLILLMFTLLSCGQKPEEESREAIDIALTHLSNEDCDEALEVLKEVKEEKGAVYLQVLASAYACKAKYDEISFITKDLTGMSTSSGPDIFKSLASMSLSPETKVDSPEYTSMKKAIQVLIGSTSGSPSHSARVKKFGKRKADDMGIQVLLLSLNQLGKFLNIYGDADKSGKKGQKTGNNSCFINYTDVRAIAHIGSGAGGVCNSTTDGHPELVRTSAAGRRRMCEGLIVLTNIFDVLDNMVISSSSELSVLKDISKEVNKYRENAEAAGIGSLFGITSQSTCEKSMETTSNLNDLELLYALVYETGLQ